MPYLDDIDNMTFDKPPAGQVTLTFNFKCDEEEKDFVIENLTRLVLARIEQWPASVWDERADFEWQKD